MQIEDGTGRGKLAKVNDANQLHTFSLIEFPVEASAHNGQVFTVASDFINITTTASFTGFLYLLENSLTKYTHIETIRCTSTVNCLWQLIKNPTAGTLISGGTAVTPQNTNFSSGRSMELTAKKTTAGAGLTITDGTLIGQWMTSAYTPFVYLIQGSMILGTGDTIALLCKPAAAGDMGSTFTMWEEEFGTHAG